MKRKKIRVGMVGIGRGSGGGISGRINDVADLRQAAAMEQVAICGLPWQKNELINIQKQFAAQGKKLGIYTDYDKFLEHDTEAVVLANTFHQHAPFAIKALKAGKHVMSEITACFTLAEGVALVREVERSRKIYMCAENYQWTKFNHEMHRLYQAGKIGEFMYGEGEYVHPFSPESHNKISPGINHWRHWLPATYYCTHSLGPVMYITGTRPVKVNGFVIARPENHMLNAYTVCRNDAASAIVLQMNNGAVVKLLQGFGLEGHSVWTSIHGSCGVMENLRDGDITKIRLIQDRLDKKTGIVDRIEETRDSHFPLYGKIAEKCGHWGADFYTNYYFQRAILTGKQPFFDDVYCGVTMSCVAILAYRSALNNSGMLEIPDFRKESVRKKFENDHWNPDPTQHKQADPWPSILGNIKPAKTAVVFAMKKWEEIGYKNK